jgi:hypothetical protein
MQPNCLNVRQIECVLYYTDRVNGSKPDGLYESEQPNRYCVLLITCKTICYDNGTYFII